ncbi:MAG: DUF4956 domain-containing protein [candidate division KSB1 bacterium]|nr:DUF4956 domain-containing protein [candidate division KSB1 bacterium]
MNSAARLDALDALLFNAPTFSFFDVLINLVIAFFLGMLIATVYRLTFKGYAYSASLVNTLILITMVTTMVIMVIGNNLARAFGLVGAMSIIRFRTAVKDTRDIAFLFFALAAGLAAGAGNHMVALIGCAAVSLVVLVLFFLNYGVPRGKELLLRFWMMPSTEDTPPYLAVFERYLKNHTLVNMRSARMGQMLELSFNVKFKDDAKHQRFIHELSEIPGIDRVSLIIGEDTDEPIA